MLDFNSMFSKIVSPPRITKRSFSNLSLKPRETKDTPYLKGLENLEQSKQRVCVVKSVNIDSDDIVWFSFKPFIENTITWNEVYGLYSSADPIVPGGVIRRMSWIDNILMEKEYDFLEAGYFVLKGDINSPYSYKMVNLYDTPLTFGLSLNATVNGTTIVSGINAVRVLNNNSAEFTPLDTISIYTSSQYDNGAIISRVSSEVLTLSFADAASRGVHYDSTTNKFVYS
eukprot:gene5733-7130_t